jgi:hypothetical protein
LAGADGGAGMIFLLTLKKLLFGETWLLPLGLALAVLITLVFRDVLGDRWQHVGGFVLLAGVLTVITTSVSRSARG